MAVLLPYRNWLVQHTHTHRERGREGSKTINPRNQSCTNKNEIFFLYWPIQFARDDEISFFYLAKVISFYSTPLPPPLFFVLFFSLASLCVRDDVAVDAHSVINRVQSRVTAASKCISLLITQEIR